MSTVQFKGARCRGEVQSLGGMLGPVYFDLGDNHVVQPFAVAPWGDVPAAGGDAALPGVLRRLRGEWPCVPFGAPGSAAPRPDLPPDWLAGRADAPAQGADFHGFGSNENWVLSADAQGVAAHIAYPAGHAIERLERRVWPDARLPVLHCELVIHPRADCRVPVGLHPVLRLPRDADGEPGKLHLLYSEPALRAWSFPTEVEPGRSVLRPDQRDQALGDIRSASGMALDPHAMPFDTPGEDLLMLTGFTGQNASIEVGNRAEGYALTLEWNAQDFPSCLLWISNRGRAYAPWNGQFRALGIEPIAAPFDLGPAHAAHAQSPLDKAGVATAIELRAGQPWRTRYSMRCARA